MHAQDSRLGWVDDRCPEERPKNPSVADCESAAIHVFDGQFILPRLEERQGLRRPLTSQKTTDKGLDIRPLQEQVLTARASLTNLFS